MEKIKLKGNNAIYIEEDSGDSFVATRPNGKVFWISFPDVKRLNTLIEMKENIISDKEDADESEKEFNKLIKR